MTRGRKKPPPGGPVIAGLSALQAERFAPLLEQVQPGGAVIAQITGGVVRAACVTPAQAAEIKRILDGPQG